MFAKLSSLSLLAGVVALSAPSVAHAGAGGGANLNCGIVAGADVNASCQFDITKATLNAAVGASCTVGGGGETSVKVDVGSILESCRADADVTGFLSSTLQALVDCKAQLAADVSAELKGQIDATIQALVEQKKLSADAAAALHAIIDSQIEVLAAAQCDAHFGLSAVTNLDARLDAFCGAKADAHVAALGLLSCDVDAAADLEAAAGAACDASVDANAALQCNGALALGVDVDLAIDLDLDGHADVGIDILGAGKAQFANGFLNVDANFDGLVDFRLPVAISAVAGVSGGIDAPKLSADVDVDGNGSIDLTIELNGAVSLDLDLDVNANIDISLGAAVNVDANGDAKIDVSALGLDLSGNGKIDTAIGVRTVSGSFVLPGGTPTPSPDAGDPSAPESSSNGGCSTAPGLVVSSAGEALVFASAFALLGMRRRRRAGKLADAPPCPPGRQGRAPRRPLAARGAPPNLSTPAHARTSGAELNATFRAVLAPFLASKRPRAYARGVHGEYAPVISPRPPSPRQESEKRSNHFL